MIDNSGLLVVIGGLPGVGKTSISKKLANIMNAVYLRIDTIEQSLIKAEGVEKLQVGGGGYYIAAAIAKDNLKAGNVVIADSVNPITLTRDIWKRAAEPDFNMLEVEIICLDKIEHRRRVNERIADIDGHNVPTWDEVEAREYETWTTASITIDTAKVNIDEAVEQLIHQIKQLSHS